MKSIESFISNWNEQKMIGGKSFDDLFIIDGVPLWWFYRRLIVRHVLPKYVNTYDYMLGKKKFDILARLRFKSAELLSPKLFLKNEKEKIIFMKKKNSFSAKPKALFLSYTPHLSEDNKVFRLEKLTKILKSEHIKPLTLFADPLSKKTYKRIIGFDNIYSYWDKEIDKKAQLLALKLHEQWKCLSNDTKEKMFCYGQKKLWPYLQYPINFFFSKEFLYVLILYYEIFRKILTKENIKIAVNTGTSSLFEKCLIAACKKHKIPVIVIEHGIGKSSINPDIVGDVTLAVFSGFYKERLVKMGVPSSHIEIVGPVVFDEISDFISPTPHNKHIIMATSPFVETGKINVSLYFERIKNILKELAKIPSVKVSIKLHPRETHYQRYVQIAKQFDFVSIFKPNISRDEFYGLIKDCNVFIGFGSNSALEAMIIDRPIITLNLLDGIFKFEHWLSEIDATIDIGYNDDIKKAVLAAFKNETVLQKKRKKIVMQLCGKVDGKASQKVAQLIKNKII